MRQHFSLSNARDFILKRKWLEYKGKAFIPLVKGGYNKQSSPKRFIARGGQYASHLRLHVLWIFIFLLVVSCHSPKGSTTEDAQPELRNIILLIGDGMGITQISAGMFANQNRLSLEQFPVIGLHKPYSANNLITDSAAGATAFASGVKTYNGAIGVNTDTLPVQTILEEMEGAGYCTGLIATSTIVHATPAAFIAHEKNRRMYDEIATWFLKTDINLFIGGGMRYFKDRPDGRNLIQELNEKGYVVKDSAEIQLENLPWRKTNKLGYLTSYDSPARYSEGRDYLVPSVERGLDFLKRCSKKGKGFFLMVEGSQIDWGGHANDSEYIISEMLEFDRAVAAALAFAKKDKHTLVIVTADHETGGYAILPGSSMDDIHAAFNTDYHTADLIPVFAYGPGAEYFSGIYENTELYFKMKKALKREE